MVSKSAEAYVRCLGVTHAESAACDDVVGGLRDVSGVYHVVVRVAVLAVASLHLH